MKLIRKRLTYANTMSTIAVFLVLGGATAFAAGQLPENSVGSKQLKKNAVTGAKVRDGSLKATDFETGQLPAGPKGDIGPQGSQGPQGPKGETGEIGPSDAYEVGDASDSGSTPPLALNLPAGNYIAFAKYTAYAPTQPTVSTVCVLSDGTHNSNLYSTVEQAGVTQNSASGSILVHLTSSGSVTLSSCNGSASFGFANINAVKVGALH